MINSPKIIEEHIDTSQDDIFKIIRYCASDKVPNTIFSVLGDLSPVDYAKAISKSHGIKIFDLFSSNDKKTPSDVKEGWTFDKLVEVSSLVRIAEVRTTLIKDSLSLLQAIIPYSLIIENSNKGASRYSGLINFKENIETTFKEIAIRRDTHSIGMIDRFVNSIGSSKDPNWILYNKDWKDVLSNREFGFFILRCFLHAVILSHTVDDKICKEMVEVDRETVIRDIFDFLELRENPKATQKDIRKFLNQIEHYTTDVPINTIAFFTFTQHFEAFKQTHDKHFGNRFLSFIKNPLKEEHDRPEWKFLRSLGSQFSPEEVIRTEESPLSQCEYLIANHFEKIFNSPYTELCLAKGVNIPAKFDVHDKYTKAALKDRLAQSLTLRRFLDFRNDDLELAEGYVKDKSYFLLVVEDDALNMRGLSIVKETLEYYIKELKNTFYEREYLIIANLIDCWDRLNLFKPNKMNKSWKALFARHDNRGVLREFMFKVFEGLYIEKDEEFQFNFHMTRYDFFTALDTFNYLLSKNDHVEDIIEFMNSIPNMKEPSNINRWDQLFWLAEYNKVNP